MKTGFNRPSAIRQTRCVKGQGFSRAERPALKHWALQLADDAVAVVDDHARPEVAYLVERHAMRGAGGERVGIAPSRTAGSVSFLRSCLLKRIAGRVHCSTLCRGAQRRRW